MEREERRPTAWWNYKAGMFAHAAAAALAGDPETEAFDNFAFRNDRVK
jgi:hypothetical protein